MKLLLGESVAGAEIGESSHIIKAGSPSLPANGAAGREGGLGCQSIKEAGMALECGWPLALSMVTTERTAVN